MDKITIMSMNCRGLGDVRKRRDVMQFVRSKRFSIVFLQDTHLTENSIPYFNTLWHGKAHHSCFSSRRRGTSILINSNLPYNLIAENKSECGNFHMLVCNIYNETFLLINIYGPNEDNPAFYKSLNNMIEQFDAEHTIVAGDFNFTMKSDVDSLNYVSENNVRAKQAFLELTYKHNLVDAWRHMHPDERKYTWLRKNPLKAGRLDMYFVSDEMLNSLTDVEIIPGYRTDHNAVTLSLQGKQKRGNSIWKFNISHLNDDAYIKAVKTCITQTLKQYAVPVYDSNAYNDHNNYESIQLVISDCLFYETLIMMIRGETVKYSKQKARRTRMSEVSLETKIAEAEDKLIRSGQQNDANELDRLKNELEEIRRPMIDGLITRSRVSWHEQGERSSKYFLSLEKRNSSRKSIQYIKDGENIISNNADILQKFSDLYQSKYNQSNDIVPGQPFIANHITCKLNADESVDLDTEINMSELTCALNSMKKGKTPGSNGFSVEFFRCFWFELGPFLYRAVKESLREGDGLPSHREGIITLIPKKGKSPHTYKGWRPITLLNADYKIVSTVISNRLKSVMSKIINPAQTAYTSGRYIGENTRLVHDIIHWTKNNNKKGIILAADFEAAFESVAWNYLRLVIQELNFGPNLKKMIDHLYLNSKNHSRILLNGHLGNKIFLQRGIRQGDPGSGYLFNLAVSILTEQIIKSTRFKGIQIDRKNEIRISQYADDTILFLDGTETSVTGAIGELHKFGLQSGLKINIEKTCCMAIGTLPEEEINTELNINFVKKLKILGVLVDRDMKNATDDNIQLKMPVIKNELAQWKRRSLTPIGRICVVKSLLLSKLIHLFTSLPNPSANCIKELEKLLFGFVWGNKNDKIKRTKLVQNYSKDGLNMVHLDSFIKSMKLSWLKRLSNSQADWVALARQELPNIWHLLTYGVQKLNVLQRKTKNAFYVDLLDALIQFNKDYRPSDQEILSESIWFSDWTKYGRAIVKRWDDRGLRFIGDMYNPESGMIYSRQELENNYKIQINFLCYATLVRSLPQRFQKQVNNEYLSKPNIPYKIEMIQKRKKFSRTAYHVFVEKITDKHKNSNERLQAKWTADVGVFKEGSLQTINKVTKSTFLLYLQFRIINRIYATNKYLMNIQVIQHNTCSFCESTVETIFHLYWQCPVTQIFIKEILSHLRTKYNTVLNINCGSWFMLTDLTNIEVIIVMLSKQCIHKSRLTSRKPSLNVMVRTLKFEATKEYDIAQRCGQISAFEQKWGTLVKILT